MSRRLCLVSALIVLAACTSPESTRTRGGGPGADIGNRGSEVMMHEGSKPFHGTPIKQPAQHPPLDSANHADRLSRRTGP